ncbi:MAG: hypothetical protein JW751_17100 [Polyangiaceae bacterium]|nr:hypothetical protein [Polyangiaceae bacterium]
MTDGSKRTMGACLAVGLLAGCTSDSRPITALHAGGSAGRDERAAVAGGRAGSGLVSGGAGGDAATANGEGGSSSQAL